MALADRITALIQGALIYPDPHEAAKLLRKRARLIAKGDRSKWPSGVTVADWLDAQSRLLAAANALSPAT
jgi:hypothetical protein